LSETPRRCFRLSIGDQDTDADGVNDWEEGAVGFDPFAPANGPPWDFSVPFAGNVVTFAPGQREVFVEALPLADGDDAEATGDDHPRGTRRHGLLGGRGCGGDRKPAQ